MIAHDAFTAAADAMRQTPLAGMTQFLLDGRRGAIVAVAVCDDPQLHTGPCPRCRILEAHYSGMVRNIARLFAARDALTRLFTATATLIEEHPDLAHEHGHSEACDDRVCSVITPLKALAQTLTGGRDE